MKFEERRVRRLLARNTVLFFATLAVLFSLFGVLVFQLVSANVYRSADQQLVEVRSLEAGIAVDQVPSDDDAATAPAPTVDSATPADESAPAVGALQDTGSSTEAGILAEGMSVASDAYVASNPQLVYLWRDAEGKATATEGFYASYPTYFNEAPFDKNDLDRVYQAQVGGHAYRGINYAVEGDGIEGYLQVLVNVDSELALLDFFTKMLVVYLAAAVLVAAAVSYFLSRRTIKPIVASMNRQTEFVQNASHELRTPLAIIRATQERLLAAPNSRVVDNFEDVSAAVDETKRLARLVDDLMTLTTADGETDAAREAEPVDVAAIVRSVGELYADVADVSGKAFSVDVQSVGKVRIDADALRQVLGILLDNALKFTEEGDAVELRCEEQGGRVVLSVADTGCGIAPADRERVFERFYRADAARTTPGSGLGLSIARALVEHVGGTIEAQANSPRGTRIVVALPKSRKR